MPKRRGGDPWRKNPVGFRKMKCPVCGVVVPNVQEHAYEMAGRGREDSMFDGHLALSVMGS